MGSGVTARTAFVRRAQAPASGKRAPRAAAYALTLLFGATTVGTFACDKASSENIALWKTTEKGPAKLTATLGDRSVDPKLRAEAALALADLGKGEEAEAQVAGLPAGERLDLLKALVPAVEAAIASAGAPEKAITYRDLLFSLRALSSPDDQKRIDATLLPGLEQALRAGRARNGHHSVEKMLQAMGAASGAMLAKLLGEPIAGYPTVAELLAKVGDESARAAGGANLVARAKNQKPVPDATWKALGELGGPAAVSFLLDKVEHGDRDDARAAARALQQRREGSILPVALKVAADASAEPTLRDEMFGVVEVIGGPEAEGGLLRIIANDHAEVVRYHAFESLLVVAKVNGVVPGLEAFPAAATYKKTDVDDLLVKLIEKLGPTARPALLKALESKFPLARMAAVMSLEHLGQSSDAAPLETLVKDTTMIKGFPGGETIGKEAARVAAALKNQSQNQMKRKG